MLLFQGDADMKDLFQQAGAVETKDAYEEALIKIHTGLIVLCRGTYHLQIFHKAQRPLKNGQKRKVMPQN